MHATTLAHVVGKVDNAAHGLNHFPVDSVDLPTLIH